MKLLKLPFKLLFNRLTFAIAILIIQIFMITMAFKFFYNYIVLFFGGLSFFSFIVVAYILISKENANRIDTILKGFHVFNVSLYSFRINNRNPIKIKYYI